MDVSDYITLRAIVAVVVAVLISVIALYWRKKEKKDLICSQCGHSWIGSGECPMCD